MIEGELSVATAPVSNESSSQQDSESEEIQKAFDTGPVKSDPPASDPALKPQSALLGQIIVTQLETLREQHQAVIETDGPEAIHKMRVTTRRLQASLDLLQIDEDGVSIRKIKKRLRTWRRLLSQVRNYDVFLALLAQEMSGDNSTQGQRFKRLKALLRKRRSRMMRKVCARLAVENVNAIASRLNVKPDGVESQGAASLETNLERAERIDRDRETILRRAAERLEQRLTEFQSLAARSHPTADSDELHRLRIVAKRLRYLIETICEMTCGSVTDTLVWLRSLQDSMGRWHDLDAMGQEILRLTARKKFIKKHPVETSQMIRAAALIQKKKDILISDIFPVAIPEAVTADSYQLVRSLRGE